MQDTSGVHVWLVLAKAFHALAARAAKSLDLSQASQAALGDSDFRVLEVLLHKGSLPVNTIGPKVWLTPGSISVAIGRLEKRALVRRTNIDDRRVRLVELTAKGRTLIAKTFRIHAAAMEEVAQVLSKEERLMLLHLLKKLGKSGARSLNPLSCKGKAILI
jgi:MarR family 2-MHQ and catechol resistance regulon transcriptional repressor